MPFCWLWGAKYCKRCGGMYTKMIACKECELQHCVHCKNLHYLDEHVEFNRLDDADRQSEISGGSVSDFQQIN